MLNKFKHSIKCNKRDKVEPLMVQYAFSANDLESSPLYPTKVEMLHALQNYRETHNEISSLSMYKIVSYQLIS